MATDPIKRPENRPLIVDPDDGPTAPFPICLAGEVIKGFGRGSKELGIPTANVAESAIPKLLEHAESGIYYGWSRIEDGEVYPMVMSVGWNPYYKNTVRAAEVHIMRKFDHDFYGKLLKLVVMGFIRPEYDYVDMVSLIADIRQDMAVAERSLARPAYIRFRDDPSIARL